MMRALPFLLVVGGLTACQCGHTAPGDGDGGSDGGDGGSSSGDGGPAITCIEGAQSLQITPADQVVTTGAGGQAYSFTATATLTGGATRDVTQQVAWSVSRDDDSPVGTVSPAGVYAPPPGEGGTVTVSATDGCVTGQTHLVMKLQSSYGTPDAGTVSRFDGTVNTTTAARLPRVVYPNDQTRFPRNIYKVLFQWQKAGNDYFRLTFAGPYSTVTVYTDGVHADCASATTAGCWQADLQTWLAIAGSNAGASTTLTVDGVGPSDSNVYRAPPIQLGFSKRDVRGAIFYWSTTAAGVRRASVSDDAPEAYVVAKPVPTKLSDGSTVSCVACHTVSRSGKKLFGGTQTSTATGEFVYDVTLQPPPTPVITTQISTNNKGFGTFSPDDTRVVATVGTLLAEFDAHAGTSIGTLPVPKGTNPDWSPAGTQLVYSNQSGDSPGNAGLDVISVNNGAWGAIRSLAPASGLTNLFPSFSPSGDYVAYARGKGGHGDKTLQLHLIKADGSKSPIELLTANRVVNNCLGVTCDANGRTNGQYENNMPTWAPAGDLDWVAFNSLRPYGVVLPAGGTQQIWVSAIDRSKLGATLPDGGPADPSYPAFRFAFQGLTENNHRAYWTLDVRAPDADAGTCLPAGSLCDANSLCCPGADCQAAGELVFTCQPPSDGGVGDGGTACIAEGSPCNQISGPSCCNGLACDVGADGGVVCRSLVIN